MQILDRWMQTKARNLAHTSSRRGFLGRFGAVLGPYAGGVLIASGTTMEVNFIIFAVPLILSGIIAYILSVK